MDGGITKRIILLFSLILLMACVEEVKKRELRPLYWPEPPALSELTFDGFLRGMSGKDLGPAVLAGGLGLGKPYGIAVSENDEVYVTDLYNRSIFRFDRRNDRTSVFGQGILKVPLGIALHEGKVYVVDAAQNQIFVFRGKALERSFGRGYLKRPSGITFGMDGRIYVTSTFTHKVVVFSPDGKHLFSFGKRGSREGDLFLPVGIAVDGEEVYVVEEGNRRVQVFGTDGRFRRPFGKGLIPSTLFGRPKGIEIDERGNIYVTDTLKNRFYVFDKYGKIRYSVGRKGLGRGRFQIPGEIRSRNGFLYVADQLNQRIQIFRFLEK